MDNKNKDRIKYAFQAYSINAQDAKYSEKEDSYHLEDKPHTEPYVHH